MKLDPTILQNTEDVLTKNFGIALTYRQIAARIQGKKPKNVKDLIPYLRNLTESQTIAMQGRNKYFKPYSGESIIGKLDIKKTGEALVLTADFPEDIYIESGLQKNAMTGDTVEVAILAKKGKKVKAEVVRIIERNKIHYAGILQVHKDFAFLVTDDRKMHKDIFIPRSSQPDFKADWNGQKALVEITEWPEGAKNPFGKVVKILGRPGENETEMNAIVTEFGFLTDFPAEVMAESNALCSEIPQEEIQKRHDMRSITTFTIDPANAKDFDDALSVKKINDRIYEIGVHIADVSYYVPQGSAIDREAFRRGTSVYLVDRTIPMLPEKLSNDLCSLKPHQDRPAFSALIRIDLEGNISKVQFKKTLIHSDHRFTYESAQEVLNTLEGPYFEELKILNSLAKTLKSKRFKEGSMSFESREFYFTLDEKGTPTSVSVKQRSDTHFLVEEWMLMANRQVAKFGKKIFDKQEIPFLFRFHDQPYEIKLAEFKKFAEKWGYKVKLNSPNMVKKSINQLLEQIKGKVEEGMLSQLAIRSMAKAVYTPYKTSHFGLGFEYYTHFTSPIRRYPDLIVHRKLQQILGPEKKKSITPIKELEVHAKHCSNMEQKATDAERASVKYKQAEWMKQFIGQTFDAIITGVTDWGIFAEITENKCEGLIKLSSIKDDMYDLDEYNMCLIGRYYNKKLSLGDSIQIKVKEANPLARTIDFYLVYNEQPRNARNKKRNKK